MLLAALRWLWRSGRRLLSILASLGLVGHGLAVAMVGLPLLLLPATPAEAATCSYDAPTQSQTYTYSAATITQAATVTFTANINCTGVLALGAPDCFQANFTSPATSAGAATLPYQVSFTDGFAGVTSNNISSATMYGPFGLAIAAGNLTIPVSVSVTVPAGNATSAPWGTYSSTVKLGYANSAVVLLALVCPSSISQTTSTPVSAFTANFVIPPTCSVSSTSNVAFTPIGIIGSTSSRIDATGAVSVNCSAGATYTIYLGDGGNRISGGGNRQMSSGSNLLPYQLYKDNGRTSIWDTTGGTTATGGSGGVTLTGTGAAASTTVYASIPAGTALPPPGSYNDTVVVTVAY